MAEKSFAQIAYEAYCSRLAEKRRSIGVNHVTETIWEHLSPFHREAWEAAVTTIKESTKGRQPVEIDHECG